jgi:hypothetical protein
VALVHLGSVSETCATVVSPLATSHSDLHDLRDVRLGTSPGMPAGTAQVTPETLIGVDETAVIPPCAFR